MRMCISVRAKNIAFLANSLLEPRDLLLRAASNSLRLAKYVSLQHHCLRPRARGGGRLPLVERDDERRQQDIEPSARAGGSPRAAAEKTLARRRRARSQSRQHVRPSRRSA